jgi:hypothetical protein
MVSVCAEQDGNAVTRRLVQRKTQEDCAVAHCETAVD